MGENQREERKGGEGGGDREGIEEGGEIEGNEEGFVGFDVEGGEYGGENG